MRDCKSLSWMGEWDRKTCPELTNCYHKACLAMTNSDYEGGVFLFHPYKNNGSYFLLSTKYLILY